MQVLGVDIGGTKVQASLVEESGKILIRKRCRTPRDSDSAGIIETVNKTLRKTLKEGGVSTDQLAAIGIIAGTLMPKDGAGHVGHLLAAYASWAAYATLLAVKTIRGLTGRRLSLATVIIFLLSLGVFAFV